MALPRRYSRLIVVDGRQYRWSGYLYDYFEPGYVVIERATQPRQKVRAEFSLEKLKEEYERVGKRVSRDFDHVPPYVVRQVIRYALARGWKPDSGGGMRDFGCLDDQIDFSELQPDEDRSQAT